MEVAVTPAAADELEVESKAVEVRADAREASRVVVESAAS